MKVDHTSFYLRFVAGAFQSNGQERIKSELNILLMQIKIKNV